MERDRVREVHALVGAACAPFRGGSSSWGRTAMRLKKACNARVVVNFDGIWGGCSGGFGEN